jgi:hypothetical protein
MDYSKKNMHGLLSLARERRSKSPMPAAISAEILKRMKARPDNLKLVADCEFDFMKVRTNLGWTKEALFYPLYMESVEDAIEIQVIISRNPVFGWLAKSMHLDIASIRPSDTNHLPVIDRLIMARLQYADDMVRIAGEGGCGKLIFDFLTNLSEIKLAVEQGVIALLKHFLTAHIAHQSGSIEETQAFRRSEGLDEELIEDCMLVFSIRVENFNLHPRNAAELAWVLSCLCSESLSYPIADTATPSAKLFSNRGFTVNTLREVLREGRSMGLFSDAELMAAPGDPLFKYLISSSYLPAEAFLGADDVARAERYLEHDLGL